MDGGGEGGRGGGGGAPLGNFLLITAAPVAKRRSKRPWIRRLRGYVTRRRRTRPLLCASYCAPTRCTSLLGSSYLYGVHGRSVLLSPPWLVNSTGWLVNSTSRYRGHVAFCCSYSGCKRHLHCTTGRPLARMKMPLRTWLRVVFYWSCKVPFTSIQTMKELYPQVLSSQPW